MSSWSYRGTTLDSLGVVTLVSDSLKMAKRRGSNVLIPFMDGRLHTQKFFDERTLTLGLEVIETSMQALEEKIDVIKKLLGTEGLGQLQQTLESGSVRNASAEFTGDLSITRSSPHSAKLLLDFVLPEPFFRSNTLTTNEQTINASPFNYVFNNPGSVRERKPKITFTGPLQNTEIVNDDNDVSIKYNGSIASGHYVVVDVNAETGEFTAVTDLGANVIGNITHELDVALFVLNSGNNNISVTDDLHTTGKVKIEFYAPNL